MNQPENLKAQPEGSARFGAAHGSAASDLAHTCCVCGHHWESVNLEIAKDVMRAVKVNKQGPYCDLCLHLEMAERYAKLRGYRSLQEAVSEWHFAKATQHNAQAHRPPTTDV